MLDTCNDLEIPRDVAWVESWNLGWVQGPGLGPGVQFNRHLEFKAWVKVQLKAGVMDGFRKAPDRAIVKVWVKA